MKSSVTAKDKKHLQELMKIEIESNGIDCDLNHIDVTNVTDMSYLFYGATFKGDISKWDVSKVTNMEGMFVISTFNGNISEWDVSNVTNMNRIFHSSYFRGDLSNWKPYKLKHCEKMFSTPSVAPYWAEIEDQEERNQAIEKYHMPNELNEILPFNSISQKKLKI